MPAIGPYLGESLEITRQLLEQVRLEHWDEVARLQEKCLERLRLWEARERGRHDPQAEEQALREIHRLNQEMTALSREARGLLRQGLRGADAYSKCP